MADVAGVGGFWNEQLAFAIFLILILLLLSD